MNDIIPPPRRQGQVRPSQPSPSPQPSRPLRAPVPQPARPVTPVPEPAPQAPQPTPPPSPKKRWSWKKRLLVILGALVALGAAAAVAGFFWYQSQLTALDPNTSERHRIEIASGTSPEQIASQLKQHKIIRSEQAFSLYLLLSGTRGDLKAGKYRLSAKESVPELVKHLTSGVTESFSITFYPGGMLQDQSDTAENKKTDVKTQLKKAGFTDDEITEAFQASYQIGGLFAGRPSGEGLEGYIYGDTYNFPIDVSAETVVQRSLEELAAVVKKHNLEALYKKRGLSLYEGITLASIIQREVHGEQDEKIVAQIFLKRLKENISLGADATFEYAAKKAGVPSSPDIESPYNTRNVKGLPPGPISAPGLSALLAVAHPASTDYLYFVSGDDEKNYFAKTLQEHEANVSAHCRVKCGL